MCKVKNNWKKIEQNFMIIIFGKAFNSQFWNKMAFALSTNTLSKEVNKNIIKKLNDLKEVTKFENFDKYEDYIHKLIQKSYMKKMKKKETVLEKKMKLYKIKMKLMKKKLKLMKRKMKQKKKLLKKIETIEEKKK